MGLFTLLLSGSLVLIAFVTVAAGGATGATAAITITNPSQEALGDIPAALLSLFITEAGRCTGLPWTVIAGISKVETDHGRFGGSQIEPEGTVVPSIIGIALDGTNGTAAITDTDDGALDHDRVWDRAVGPFQFIPASWRLFGGDGNGDEIADPNNIYDAVPAVVRHLCPDGVIGDIGAAIYGYNNSAAYVSAVLEWAQRYTGPLAVGAVPIAGYALPVPAALVTEATLTAPHHDYPAWDVGLPVGTPVSAMTAGTITVARTPGVYPADPNRCGDTVTLAGIDGVSYTYCHLSQVAVTAGQIVDAGFLIGLSGGQPGAPGAGNTTGPHLHLAVTLGGAAVCPQPLLLAMYRLTPIHPVIAPSVGCVQGGATTDWATWLEFVVPSPIAEEEPA
jgi:hypothetical protein